MVRALLCLAGALFALTFVLILCGVTGPAIGLPVSLGVTVLWAAVLYPIVRALVRRMPRSLPVHVVDQPERPNDWMTHNDSDEDHRHQRRHAFDASISETSGIRMRPFK